MTEQSASIQSVLTQYMAGTEPRAKLFVRRTRNAALVPLYGDPDLTSQIGNPLRADETGAFPECHVEAGVYHLLVEGAAGQTLLEFQQIALQGPAEMNIAHVFASVWHMLGDTAVKYASEAPGVLTSLSAGDMVHVTSENLSYRVLTPETQQPQLMTAGGLKLELLQAELTPEGFGSIEEAILAAAQSGKSLRGTPGKTYVFTEGVTIEDLPVNVIFEGCRLMRGMSVADNQPALEVRQSYSANTYSNADTISSYSLEEYDYGNGPIFVPRITVPDVSGYAVGDVVRVMGDDIIPSIAPWTQMRYADMGEVGAVDPVTNTLHLIRPFAEDWTPKKLVRLSTNQVRITGGEWYDVTGYPVTRHAPMVRLIGALRPTIRNVWFRDTASMQLQIGGCYEGRSLDNRFERPRHDPVYDAYGYGEKLGGGTVRHVQNRAQGSGCRHVFDTGGRNLSPLGLLNASPDDFGGAVECVCRNGDAMDSLNAPWADHPDAYRTQFINCTSRWSNRRAPSCTLWGLELRGRGSSAEGGQYEGLQPLRIEPSTETPMLLRNITLMKHAPEQNDAGRGALIDIAGAGVVTGGRAQVCMYGIDISQHLGRREVIYAENCALTFSGNLRFAADLSNPVVFRLLESALTVMGLDADFSSSDPAGVTPMLSVLEDNTSTLQAPGLVRVLNAPGSGSTIVLTDFASEAGTASWHNVMTDGPLYASDGWRNETNAVVMRAQVRAMDGSSPPNDVVVNFSSGAGAKSINWPKGCAMDCIYVSVKPTALDTYVGTLPSGSFVGQRLLLVNIGADLDFEIFSSTDISVTAPRTVHPGQTAMLRWDGTLWQG